MSNLKKYNEVFISNFEAKEEELSSMSYNSAENWDSVGHMGLIASLEEMLDQDREYVIKKLGLSEDEFELILKSPNKNYSDYFNNESLWKRFNGIIRVAKNYITRVG